MLAKLYVKLCDVYPKFRKATRKQMYQFMAGYYQKQDWTFMNYGYAPDDEVETPTLEADDEINRYCIQLYHHVANAINLKGLKVLEVGSGRGGGANYIKRYLNPAQMVGVDFSDKAVDLCREHYRVEGLSFMPGDAEDLHLSQLGHRAGKYLVRQNRIGHLEADVGVLLVPRGGV